jgi:hypothetical protein
MKICWKCAETIKRPAWVSNGQFWWHSQCFPWWESFHDFTHLRTVTVRTSPEGVDWYGGDTGRLN